jgi:hypothetical protein
MLFYCHWEKVLGPTLWSQFSLIFTNFLKKAFSWSYDQCVCWLKDADIFTEIFSKNFFELATGTFIIWVLKFQTNTN